ncbi:MAG: HAMP domain-containing sensor histidine kinase, partial [Lysobacterales bacterium]
EQRGHEETYHVARREFRLNARPHTLLLFKRLTAELSRQEVATWKKVIRVISHELNNSLAPVTSLSHSGAELVRRGEYDRLGQIFATIEERGRHLHGFIRGYASVAKLPSPTLEAVLWSTLLAGVRAHYDFAIPESLPDQPAQIDAAQIAQALINLVKNAHESGSQPSDIRVSVLRAARSWAVCVSDRGQGMSDAVLASALVPFYSTKRSGTGLGLALVREIAEAHGGRVMLANRQGGGLAVTLTLPA